ncbi:DUF4893 domain-containing protein [Sphingomonas sp. RS6]
MYRLAFASIAGLILAACTTSAASGVAEPPAVAEAVPPAPPPPLWRQRIADDDVPRLDALASAWRELYGALRASTRRTQGALLDPETRQPHPALPPGSYRCRTYHLRPASRGPATVQATAPAFCYISAAPDDNEAEDAPLGLAKQTGSDIVAGYVFPDGRRSVFLGARQRRPGDNSVGYGETPDRDVVGVVERFGPFRWRLAVHGTRDGSIDVVELTPMPVEVQPKG